MEEGQEVMSNRDSRHDPGTLRYSAGSVTRLLWYIETKETVKLFQKYGVEETKNIVLSNNLYSQRSEDRLKREFHVIRKRVESLPVNIRDMIVSSDLVTSKLIVLIGVMATDRMFFELMYEVYRRKLHMGDELWKQSDINIFFRDKQDRNEDVARWSEKAVNKLKQTYQRYMLEAGLLETMKDSGPEKRVVRPYMEPELRDGLLSGGLDKYLYSLTGEK